MGSRRRPRLRDRIEFRRQRGLSAAEIARYVHNTCGPGWSRKIPWTAAEHQELLKLDCEAAQRKAAKAAQASARQTSKIRVAPIPRPPNLGKCGLSARAARDILGCSAIELNRWASDGRLPADGQRFYYGVGPLGGSKWHRAWLPETVDRAIAQIAGWRKQDNAERGFRWTSEAMLLELVQSRYPDAVP